MYISIQNNKKYTNGFLHWCLRRFTIHGILYLNKNKQKANIFNQYLNEIFGLNNINASSVILLGLNNLKFKFSEDKIIIYVDDKIFIPGTNVTIESVCKFIDRGSVEIAPFPIFTELFSYALHNIGNLHKEFTYNVI